MFLEAKPDGLIRHLVDLHFRNNITMADPSQITNQQTILYRLFVLRERELEDDT